MYKKEYKDSHARVCLSRLTRVLDMDILEDLQQLEYTGNVTRNLEIESNLKPHRTFFSQSSEKINKIISRKGRILIYYYIPVIRDILLAMRSAAGSENCRLS